MKKLERKSKPYIYGSESSSSSAAIPLARLKPEAIDWASSQVPRINMQLTAKGTGSSIGPPLAHLKPDIDEGGTNPSRTQKNCVPADISLGKASCSDTSQSSLEGDVRRLHERLWVEARRAGYTGADRLFASIDPYFAAEMLGYSVEFSSDQREDLTCTKRQGIVATLDNKRRNIWVRSSQNDPEKRFCVAHELGHLVRHPGISFHRDRTAGFLSNRRPPMELEADRFASNFLMPARLVRNEFEGRFGDIRSINRDDLMFYLGLQGKRRPTSIRDWSLALATARRVAARRFEPLNVVFSVSGLAMAIRLEELGLVTT